MTALLLDEAQLAHSILEVLHEKVQAFIEQGNRAPGLAVILIGNDPASQIYVKNKLAACKSTGIVPYHFHFESTITQQLLLDQIHSLNQDTKIDGLLVQLPLPEHIHKQSIVESILPDKDVDGFHPYNIGRLFQQSPCLRPCTPAGIMQLLQKTGVDLTGQHAVVIGTSDIVGRPMLLELLMANCTVTVCHRHTQDLEKYVNSADLVISAVGQPNLIKGHWIKPGAIVIDVGMNRMDNGDITGDVEFEIAKQHAAWITPVPGGVGPMTVATLLSNTLLAYEHHLTK